MPRFEGEAKGVESLMFVCATVCVCVCVDEVAFVRARAIWKAEYNQPMSHPSFH